jgi:hypothetical protein
VLRFLRVFRLFRSSLFKVSDAVSPEVLTYMKTITVFSCFIEAHLSSQVLLIKYFGGNGKIDSIDEAELARCILQSQVEVYKAITVIVSAKKRMDADLLNEMEWAVSMLKVTEGLEKFVMDAHEDGAINDRDTESILHPLHHKISECLKTLEKLDRGHKPCRQQATSKRKSDSIVPVSTNCFSDSKGDVTQAGGKRISWPSQELCAVLPAQVPNDLDPEEVDD